MLDDVATHHLVGKWKVSRCGKKGWRALLAQMKIDDVNHARLLFHFTQIFLMSPPRCFQKGIMRLERGNIHSIPT